MARGVARGVAHGVARACHGRDPSLWLSGQQSACVHHLVVSLTSICLEGSQIF